MNVSMHEVTVVDGRVLSPVGEQIVGYMTLQEAGRASTGELYFSGSEACQKAADKLAELAEKMRRMEQ